MRFDTAIGNPPFQEDPKESDNKGYSPPVYHLFMEAAFQVADKVELIHPGRFLFNAGSTPKSWNQKMLNDPHFKVLQYEQDASTVFNNTSIMGGIAVTYRDRNKEFGAIETFTAYPELNDILGKVKAHPSFCGVDSIAISRTVYRLTELLHRDYPEAINQLSSGHAYDMASNIFERLPQVFYDSKPKSGGAYVKMLGRKSGDRAYMYIKREYVKEAPNLEAYKIVLARADGASGTIGNPIPARIIGTPSIEGPLTGTTESFLSIGVFKSLEEAKNALQYVKTKFARTLVGILKTTQDITPDKWKYVPLQDFTDASDIDWTKPIPEIDRQLYSKYDLDQSEIDFIETHVKEME